MQPSSAPPTLAAISWWMALLEVVVSLAVLVACLLAIILITSSALVAVLATPLAAALLTVLLRRRGESWATLGLRRPARSLVAIAQAVIIAAAVLATLLGVESALAPSFAERDETFLDAVTGNAWLYVYFIAIVSWLSQGLGEELLFRGFIMNRLAQAFGLQRIGWAFALIGQGVLFGLMHSYQGPAGMIATGAAGVVFGIGYLATGRNLWPCVIAHALCGTVLITMVYVG